MRRTEKTNLQAVWDTSKRALSDWQYLVGFAGNAMTRFGVKTTVLMGVVGALGYGVHGVGSVFDKDWGYTLPEALSFPSATGLFILVPGVVAKLVPRIFSSKVQAAVQAGGLNLMEDYRKEHVEEHLKFLWERVFEPESLLTYTGSERQKEREFVAEQLEKLNTNLEELLDSQLKLFLGVGSERDFNRVIRGMTFANPFTDKLEKTYCGFRISSMNAVIHPRSRSRRKQEVGYDLGQLIDWYDGAPFDGSDTKLREVFSGDRTMRMLKKEIPGQRLRDYKMIPREIHRSISFYLRISTLAAELVRQSNVLNRDYDTSEAGEDFTVQGILYPEDGKLDWLDKVRPRHADLPSAKEALLNAGREAIIRKYGKTWREARGR